MRGKYIALLSAALLTVGCSDEFKLDDASDMALFVSPDTCVTLDSGDFALYHLTLHTPHEYVDRLKVSSFDAYNGEMALLDTVFGGNSQSIECNFAYKAPESDRDTLSVGLKFVAANSRGDEHEVQRRVKVVNRFVQIAEKSGIVLYAPASGKPDALCFSDVSQTFVCDYAPETLLADLYISDFDNLTWRSKSEAKFVRVNNFDYANASVTSITNIYKSSVYSDFVSDIKINDIIIVGHAARAEGVFFVRSVVRDANNPELNCMQLAFKGIKQLEN